MFFRLLVLGIGLVIVVEAQAAQCEFSTTCGDDIASIQADEELASLISAFTMTCADIGFDEVESHAWEIHTLDCEEFLALEAPCINLGGVICVVGQKLLQVSGETSSYIESLHAACYPALCEHEPCFAESMDGLRAYFADGFDDSFFTCFWDGGPYTTFQDGGNENPTPTISYCDTSDVGDCTFYETCLEPPFGCGATGYALSYGKVYCERFTESLPDFTADGQQWITYVLSCLQTVLLPYLSQDLTCGEVKSIAFDSHPSCYINGGVCVIYRDWFRILWVIRDQILTLDSLSQILNTFAQCGIQGGGYIVSLFESTIEVSADVLPDIPDLFRAAVGSFSELPLDYIFVSDIYLPFELLQVDEDDSVFIVSFGILEEAENGIGGDVGALLETNFSSIISPDFTINSLYEVESLRIIESSPETADLTENTPSISFAAAPMKQSSFYCSFILFASLLCWLQ